MSRNLEYSAERRENRAKGKEEKCANRKPEKGKWKMENGERGTGKGYPRKTFVSRGYLSESK